MAAWESAPLAEAGQPAWMSAPVAQRADSSAPTPDETFGGRVKRNALGLTKYATDTVLGAGSGLGTGVGKTVLGGQYWLGRGVRAIGNAGAAIAPPQTSVTDLVTGNRPTTMGQRVGDWLIKDAEQGRVKLDRENAPYAQAAPMANSVGKVAGEVITTLPVAGALAAPIRAVAPKVLGPLATAVASGGFRGGITAPGGANLLARMAYRAADLGIRSLGGAITGGVSAGLVEPGTEGTGALIGAALPPALKSAGMVGSAIGSGIKAASKNVLGVSTGAGAEPINQAFKAGQTGNKDFLQNMRGEVSLTDVLDRAKQGLQAMNAAKAAEYRSGMIPIAGDKSILSFGGIDQALDDAARITTYKGQVKNDAAAAAVAKMRDTVDNWRQLNPSEFHTPEGLDALKQKLGDLLDSIPYNERSARLAAGKVYNATKSEIAKQAPAYAKVMKSYSDASNQISEIERALSLGDGASKDTAMRKLQSLMRNNVQTNYGNRLSLANTLEQEGGVDLLPSLAGQALNSWTPRSLSGQIGSGATAVGAMMSGNPLMLTAIPFQSPRAVGTAAYGLGRLTGAASNGASMVTNNPIAGLIRQKSPDLIPLVYRAAPVIAADR